MAARTLGWGQRRVQSAIAQIASVNGYLGTGSHNVTTAATDLSFEVTAGTSVTISYGWNDPSNILGEGSAANTTTITVNAYYETATTLWETAATASQVTVGAAPTSQSYTLTFTPTHTGTVRLFVSLQVKVTSTGTVLNFITSDAGNFGTAAETLGTGISSTSFTPGLVRAGAALSSLAMSGMTSAAQGYYPETGTATFTLAAAPRAADGTYTLSWRDATPTLFASSAIAAGTATTVAAGQQISPAVGFPAANTAVDLLLTPDTSALSTALSGTALPWIHFTTLPSTPGTVSGTTDGAGNFITARFAGAFQADPRLKVHCHATASSTFAADNTSPTPPWDAFNQDIYLYIISADLFYCWFSAFNQNNIGQNAITGTVHLADPTVATPTSGGAGDHTTTLITTTVAGNTLGWSRASTPFQFTPAPPSGAWHLWCESATDGTSTWTRTSGYLIFGQGNSDTSGSWVGFSSTVNFISAYRDNIVLVTAAILATGAATVTREPYPGDTVIAGFRVRKDANGSGNFIPYHVDAGTTPKIKISVFDQSTGTASLVVGSDVTGGVAMTVDPMDSSIWTYTWDTTGLGENQYFALMSAQVDGGAKLAQSYVSLFHRLSTVSGLLGLPAPAV